jgi:hypothetical protein
MTGLKTRFVQDLHKSSEADLEGFRLLIRGGEELIQAVRKPHLWPIILIF